MRPSPTTPSAQRVGTVLVTGASGNVGRHVVSSLAAAGEEVRAFVRDPDKAPAADGVEVVSGDLTSPRTLVPALREVDRVFLVCRVFRWTPAWSTLLPTTPAGSSTCPRMSPISLTTSQPRRSIRRSSG
jgi:hypothetical protein